MIERTREERDEKRRQLFGGFVEPGDIVLWKFGRCFSHGAIIVEWPTIIHAYVGQRCTLENGWADWLNTVGENTADIGQRRQRKFFSYWR